MNNDTLESLYNENKVILQKTSEDGWVFISKMEPIFSKTNIDWSKEYTVNSNMFHYEYTHELPNETLSNLTNFVRDFFDGPYGYKKRAKGPDNFYVLKGAWHKNPDIVRLTYDYQIGIINKKEYIAELEDKVKKMKKEEKETE